MQPLSISKLYLIVLCITSLLVTALPVHAGGPGWCNKPKKHQEYTRSCVPGAMEYVLWNLGINVTEDQLVNDYIAWHTRYNTGDFHALMGDPCPAPYSGNGGAGFGAGEALVAYVNYTYDVHLENLMYYVDSVDLSASPPVTKVPNPDWLYDLQQHPEWRRHAFIIYEGHCYIYRGHHRGIIWARSVSYMPGCPWLRLDPTIETPTAIYVPTTGQYEDYSWAALMWGPKTFLAPVFRNYTQ